ncbi:MAG: MoxR family ATPase [Pseudomonadota bacterium]
MPNDIALLRTSIRTLVLGKDDVIDLLLICLIGRGHLLIEDVPGVGKTTLALALARSIDGSFQRIQFTSDLLPSDVIGVPVYNAESRNFEFKPGPLFANIVLADEINRTTPKTQSALLEAMQDGHVTVERTTHPLPHPFMVIATQNPTEFHGTYPLPESQLDRFLMRITMGYPTSDGEFRILQTKGSRRSEPELRSVLTGEKVLEMQRAAAACRVDESVSAYILRIADKTRKTQELELGVSPRGSLSLYRAAQARAFVEGRDYVSPDDVKKLVVPVLAHRLIVAGRRAANRTSGDARSAAEEILAEVLAAVEVPV